MSINIKGKLVDLSIPKIMGILNINNNSFYDGGKYSSKDQALIQTEKMLNEGATFIDIGASTSKPKSKPITVENEKKILFPILEALIKKFPETFFSIDTFQSEIAERSLEIGASIINDISGGNFDNNMFHIISKYKAPYIMMHMKGNPNKMQNDPIYNNVVIEILNFFSKQTRIAHNYGIKDIIIDPGFGFGKSLKHNYQIIKSLKLFKVINCPILIGISRKSMIYQLIGEGPEEALNGTSILNTFGLTKGTNILRVHDVKEAKECVSLWEYLH